MQVIRCQAIKPTGAVWEFSVSPYGAGSDGAVPGAVDDDSGVADGAGNAVVADSVSGGSSAAAGEVRISQPGHVVPAVGVADGVAVAVAVGDVAVGTGVVEVPVGDGVGVCVGVGESLAVPDGDDDVGGEDADGGDVAVVVGVAVPGCVGGSVSAWVVVGAGVAVSVLSGVVPAVGSGTGGEASSCSPLRTVWLWSSATGMAQRCVSAVPGALPS